MRISITYDIDDETVRKCSAITGLEASVDKEGTGEIILGYSRLTARENTVMIQTASAGVDHVNFAGIREGVTVCSNAGAYSNVLGEHVFALLLSHIKKIAKFDASTRKGKYDREPVGTLEGMTFGVLGYGGIGAQSARIAKAMDMRTIAYSRSFRDEKYLDAKASSPADLFSESDILLIATALNNDTRGMVNADLLGRFNGTYIINVARSDIVDTKAMLDFLSRNPEKYYLSDVWWEEPEIKDPVPENALLTPHIGGLADRTIESATISACRNIRKFLDGTPDNVVRIGDYIRKS